MALPQQVGADEFDEPLSGRGRRVAAAAAGEVPLRRDSRRESRGRGECVYCRANIIKS